jgi:hypothetical protein
MLIIALSNACNFDVGLNNRSHCRRSHSEHLSEVNFPLIKFLSASENQKSIKFGRDFYLFGVDNYDFKFPFDSCAAGWLLAAIKISRLLIYSELLV